NRMTMNTPLLTLLCTSFIIGALCKAANHSSQSFAEIAIPNGSFALGIQVPTTPLLIPPAAPQWREAYEALKLRMPQALTYAEWSEYFAPEYRSAYKIDEAKYNAGLTRTAAEAPHPHAAVTQVILYCVEVHHN